MSWYPLGRPVGTTIYPGMQFTAVWIKRYLLPSWSLNDVCCYVPAWFGVLSTVATGMIAYECSIPDNTQSNLFGFVCDLVDGKKTTIAANNGNNNSNMNNNNNNTAAAAASTGSHRLLVGKFWSPAVQCAVFAAGMMAIVPAHLMRSMGGGFDNESVAVPALCVTFYLWIRSLRGNDPSSYKWAVPAALSYFYMVTAWGGYVFVLNLIGLHAAFLIVSGRFDTQVYRSYTIFYALGTVLAIRVPVVGWAPLKSLEQLGPAAVFGLYQLLPICEIILDRMEPKDRKRSRKDRLLLRIKLLLIMAACAGGVVLCLTPQGYFGPLSARVRGLFVKHTKTGNPLVDSVAEHQPASSRAYFQYLHHVCALAPIGYTIVCFQLSDASSFLLVWGSAAYFFSHKMVRLILLTAPIGCCLGGIVAGRLACWCVQQFWGPSSPPPLHHNYHQYSQSQQQAQTNENTSLPSSSSSGRRRKGKKEKENRKPQQQQQRQQQQYYAGDGGYASNSGYDGMTSIQEAANAALQTKEGVLTKQMLAAFIVFIASFIGTSFIRYSWRVSIDLSNPTIMSYARTPAGEVIKVDDYREAYWWLRDHTEPDARVMAWWDYGYQIAGIANRTTIADGNTWNHEHIALLGKAFTTDLDEGYEIARHWADYILVWAGGGGDDLAKSPHLARIANSVYRDHCPDDPTCRAFGFLDRKGTPSAMMERSLLYRLHGANIKDGVNVPDDKFKEVFRSKYGKVRIFEISGVSETSKAWIADPTNRQCDVAGSWFCPGQYPPALQAKLKHKSDFQQLEDFNRKSYDEEYQRKYFEDLRDPEKARKKAIDREKQQNANADKSISDASASSEHSGGDENAAIKNTKNVDEIYNTWEDTEDTTAMWKLISENAVEALTMWLEAEPHKAFIRSKDGRGPMWWAFEQRNEKITKLLMKAGVPHTDRDSAGRTPVELLGGSN